MDRVIIEHLPESKDLTGAKRWVDEKGEFVQISWREDIGHLAFFELCKGQFRGGHYHERKEEVFYVVSGTIRAVFADLGGGGKETRILEKGMKVRVGTRVGHRFEGIEDSLVIEYSPQYYDKTDALKTDMGE
jgi:L-fuculose-phosphate aldolase